MGAAHRPLCCEWLAEVVLQPQDLSSTARPDAGGAAQHTSTLTQVDCDVDHCLLEV